MARLILQLEHLYLGWNWKLGTYIGNTRDGGYVEAMYLADAGHPARNTYQLSDC